MSVKFGQTNRCDRTPRRPSALVNVLCDVRRHLYVLNRATCKSRSYYSDCSSGSAVNSV